MPGGEPSRPPMKEWITLAFVLSKAAGATLGEGLSLAFVSLQGKALDIPEGGVVALVPLANPEVCGLLDPISWPTHCAWQLIFPHLINPTIEYLLLFISWDDILQRNVDHKT